MIIQKINPFSFKQCYTLNATNPVRFMGKIKSDTIELSNNKKAEEAENNLDETIKSITKLADEVSKLVLKVQKEALGKHNEAQTLIDEALEIIENREGFTVSKNNIKTYETKDDEGNIVKRISLFDDGDLIIYDYQKSESVGSKGNKPIVFTEGCKDYKNVIVSERSFHFSDSGKLIGYQEGVGNPEIDGLYCAKSLVIKDGKPCDYEEGYVLNLDGSGSADKYLRFNAKGPCSYEEGYKHDAYQHQTREKYLIFKDGNWVKAEQ